MSEDTFVEFDQLFDASLTEEIDVSTASPAKLTERAEKVAKDILTAKKKIKGKTADRIANGVDKVIDILKQDEELNAFDEPPSAQEVRGNDSVAPTLDILYQYIQKYKDGFFRSSEFDSDVLLMAAFLSDLSKELGAFQAQVIYAKSALKKKENLAYIKAKTFGVSIGTKVTDEDAKKISEYMSRDVAERVANLEFAEKYLFNCFHSIRNFLELLSFVSGRERKAAAQGAQF